MQFPPFRVGLCLLAIATQLDDIAPPIDRIVALRIQFHRFAFGGRSGRRSDSCDGACFGASHLRAGIDGLLRFFDRKFWRRSVQFVGKHA